MLPASASAVDTHNKRCRAIILHPNVVAGLLLSIAMNTNAGDPALSATLANPTETDMYDVLELFPVPTLVVSTSHCIQSVSKGLLDAWECVRKDFVGRDLFDTLYHGSATERFDRIPLNHAIEAAIAARSLRLCYAAYTTRHASWSARIIPIFRNNELLSLVLEWEQAEAHTGAVDGESRRSELSANEAFRILVQTVKDYAIFLLDT